MKTYNASDKCTARVAAQLLHRGVRTAERYLQSVRKILHREPYSRVTVGEFCEHYHISLGC